MIRLKCGPELLSLSTLYCRLAGRPLDVLGESVRVRLIELHFYITSDSISWRPLIGRVLSLVFCLGMVVDVYWTVWLRDRSPGIVLLFRITHYTSLVKKTGGKGMRLDIRGAIFTSDGVA